MRKLLTALALLTASSCFGQSTYDQYKGTASGTNSYSVTISPAQLPVYDGQRIQVKLTNAPSGASTLKLTGSGGVSSSAITMNVGGSAVTSGGLPANVYMNFQYNAATAKWDVDKPGSATDALIRGVNEYTGATTIKNNAALKLLAGGSGSIVSYKRSSTDSTYLQYSNGGGGAAGALLGSYGNGQSTYISVFKSGLTLAGTNNSQTSNFNVGYGVDTWYDNGVLNSTLIRKDTNTIQVSKTLGTGFVGITYADDYTANFTARSLIDKGYATATFATIAGSALTLDQVLTNGNNASATGTIDDNTNFASINFNTRRCLSSNGFFTKLDWNSGVLKNSGGSTTLDWEGLTLTGSWHATEIDNGASTLINFSSGLAKNGGNTKIDWVNATLNNSSEVTKLDWQNLVLSGSWTITGDFIPTTDITYDLGTALKRWDALYLNGSSLYLGDAHFTSSGLGTNKIPMADGSNNVTFNTIKTILDAGIPSYATVAAALADGKVTGDYIKIPLTVGLLTTSFVITVP